MTYTKWIHYFYFGNLYDDVEYNYICQANNIESAQFKFRKPSQYSTINEKVLLFGL